MSAPPMLPVAGAPTLSDGPRMAKNPGGARGVIRTLLTHGSLIATSGVVAIALVLLFLTGNPVVSVIPLVVACVLYWVWTQPMRRTVIPLAFAQCFFFGPSTNDQGVSYASGPLWTMLMRPGNQMLNVYLNKVVSIGFLSLTGQELVYPLLLLLVIVREVRGVRLDVTSPSAGARILFPFLLLALAAVVVLEVRGAATGGDMRSTLFQIRTLLWLPIWTLVLLYALRDVRDFSSLAIAVTAAAILKVAVGLYFIAHDAWAQGVEVPYMTGHSDTVLYVVVIFAWFAAWVHQRTPRRLFMALGVFTWMIIGVYVNNRRLAYVSLVSVLLAFYPLLSGRFKRSVKRWALAMSPLLVVYLLLARTHTTGIFAPGAELMGIATVQDASSQWRELENANLIYTLRLHQIFGAGFGHEYVEIIPLPDISTLYPQYRLIAHNSVLWLLGAAGIIGFAVLWMPIVVGVFLSTRSYHFARTPLERTGAATALAIIVCYVMQAWGDIGLAQALPTLLLAAALAMAARLAADTGAWPSNARFWHRR